MNHTDHTDHERREIAWDAVRRIGHDVAMESRLFRRTRGIFFYHRWRAKRQALQSALKMWRTCYDIDQERRVEKDVVL